MTNMLDDKSFWQVIDKIDWNEEDNDEQIQPVIDFLAEQSIEYIQHFQETLAYKLYQLDTKEHAKNIGECAYVNDDEYFSVDSFLYARCCVVANGQELFEKVLKEPIQMPKDLDYEPLLYVADEAFAEKTGDDFDYTTKYDYETYSNIEGWS